MLTNKSSHLVTRCLTYVLDPLYLALTPSNVPMNSVGV